MVTKREVKITPKRPSTPVDNKQRLEELEQVVQKNIKAFYKVGLALQEIRDTGMYKLLGYNSFDEYCQVRWDMKRNYANKLILATSVVANLEGTEVPVLPAYEVQVRPLVQLSPDDQIKAWHRVLEEAPVINDKPRVSTKLIQQVVDEIRGKKNKAISYTDAAFNETLYQIRKKVGKRIPRDDMLRAMLDLISQDKEILDKVVEKVKHAGHQTTEEGPDN